MTSEPVALLEELPETIAEPASEEATSSQGMRVRKPVSDTHLTLPTILLV